MRELVSNVLVFAAVLLALFLFGGEKPTVFQTLQAHVRGVCR